MEQRQEAEKQEEEQALAYRDRIGFVGAGQVGIVSLHGPPLLVST